MDALHKFAVLFFWGCYSFGAFYLTAYALLQAILWFHYRKAHPQPNAPDPQIWPSVTVQLPIYNEINVVERLIAHSCALDYPKDKLFIQLLDDSTDGTSELAAAAVAKYRAAGVSIVHWQRKNRQGYKAGALAAGTLDTKTEFIAIFDADFLPDPQFLKQTLPFLAAQSNLALVQTRWTHLNEYQNIFTQLQALQLNIHFTVEQEGRQSAGVFRQFNGTAGVWRRSAIADAGGWQADTLCEDLDLSLRAQLKGWQILFLPQVEAPAELPSNMAALKSQQFRWMKGGAQCTLKCLPPLLTAKNVGRYTQFHAAAHLLSSFVFAASLLTALSSLGVAWLGATAPHFFQFGMLPTISILLFVYFWANGQAFLWRGALLRRLWHLASRFLPLVALFMGLSYVNSVAVFEAVRGKKSAFVRTPKVGHHASSAYNSSNFPRGTWVEGILSLLFLSSSFAGLLLGNYTFVPYHLLFGLGLAFVFVGSLRAKWPSK